MDLINGDGDNVLKHLQQRKVPDEQSMLVIGLMGKEKEEVMPALKSIFGMGGERPKEPVQTVKADLGPEVTGRKGRKRKRKRGRG